MRSVWPSTHVFIALGLFGAVALPNPAEAQVPCEQPVELRLRRELGLAPAETLYATRDYHPGLLPGWTFYRAIVPTGFHTRPRWAAVIIRGADTLVIRKVADLAQPWADLAARHRPSANEDALILVLGELLHQSGVLGRGDKVIHTPEEIPELIRLSFDPQTDLSQIKPPAVEVTGKRTNIILFLLTADGVTRLRARTDSQGGATIVVDVIAHAR